MTTTKKEPRRFAVGDRVVWNYFRATIAECSPYAIEPWYWLTFGDTGVDMLAWQSELEHDPGELEPDTEG